MDEADDKTIEKTNSFSVTKLIQEHLTILDLSNKNIETIDKSVKLPKNLVELNLSKNKLTEVPVSVINLENLEVLNLSHNYIKCFDEIPKFCHTIQTLCICNNDLHGPPYWIWSERPACLREINLSCNVHLTNSFRDNLKSNYERLLEYKTLITNIIIYNCKLTDFVGLISTFPNAKSLVLGSNDYSLSYNSVEEVPVNGIDQCCDLEYLNLSNTRIYNVKSDIEIFRNLKTIDLSHNDIDHLPEEFCNLENLERCLLSYNRLNSLPGNIQNLKKLNSLCVSFNELNSLPDDICRLPSLKRLDIYDNCISIMPDGIENLSEVDLANNYFDEPTNEEYLAKRNIIRLNTDYYRCDGRKMKVERSESEHSYDSRDEDLWISETQSVNNKQDVQERCSSSEDWDSDEYWVPQPTLPSLARPSSSDTWIHFVKRKIEEGNFCPIDAHPVSIYDQVMYERQCNSETEYETDGQFDDFSGDDT